MTTRPMRLVWNGARPLRSLRGGAALGSDPQRNPPSATGGPSQPPCCARGRWGRATGRTKAGKDKPFTIMHWNAESVINKKTELEHILNEENINICCIQETHLQSNKYFKVRGYHCFRSDKNRPKQRRSTDSSQKQYQRLCDKHSHGRFWVSGAGDQSRCCRHSAGELLLPQRQTPVSWYHQHRSLQLYNSGRF